MAIVEGTTNISQSLPDSSLGGGDILNGLMGLAKVIGGIATANPVMAVSGGADLAGTVLKGTGNTEAAQTVGDINSVVGTVAGGVNALSGLAAPAAEGAATAASSIGAPQGKLVDDGMGFVTRQFENGRIGSYGPASGGMPFGYNVGQGARASGPAQSAQSI